MVDPHTHLAKLSTVSEVAAAGGALTSETVGAPVAACAGGGAALAAAGGSFGRSGTTVSVGRTGWVGW
ncbi:Uncharacterised protein [Mycobacteroides abscessus subsp. massiliense]|nr:Uncharacterised protein [Mycobacteroides abscessus subsp. massiliense]